MHSHTCSTLLSEVLAKASVSIQRSILQNISIHKDLKKFISTRRPGGVHKEAGGRALQAFLLLSAKFPTAA